MTVVYALYFEKKMLGAIKRPFVLFICIILGLVIAYTAVEHYVQDAYRSIVLLAGADTRILGSVDLAGTATGAIVATTVLAIVFGFALAGDIRVVPPMASLSPSARERLSVICWRFVLLLMLAQMVVAFCAWWPRVFMSSPARPSEPDPARVIDLVVAVLGLPFDIIVITCLLFGGWEIGRELLTRPGRSRS